MQNETWRIGVDVGGTFTDIVAIGSVSGVTVQKTASNPSDPSSGVMTGMNQLADKLAIPLKDLLASCTHFVHGTTIATNTLLEGKGAKVGMLTTRGFRDALEIRRGLVDHVCDQRTSWPEVLVPRYLRQPITERVLKDGSIDTAAALEEINGVVELFRREKVTAVAVCFINSFLNDANERLVAGTLRERMPDAYVTNSADIAPVIGEYERWSTAAVNAYLAPRVLPYLSKLNDCLRDFGLPQEILLVQSNGGACAVNEISARPVSLLLSGPAAGVGALDHYTGPEGLRNFMTMEIGGTSCDVMLYERGRVAETGRLDIAGYPAMTPSVEINTVAIGGGTIAYVDGGGMLHVGPKGAGSLPGPACYGNGGEDPTISDAHVVLGRLRPGPYADGAISIDSDLARKAIEEKIAKPMGISVQDAAIGILRVADQTIVHTLERISSERGVNPARFELVACGGAGALHASSVARMLGAKNVFVPGLAGVFCAFGMTNSDVRHDIVRSVSHGLDADALSTIADEIARDGAYLRSKLSGQFCDEAIYIDTFLELKYAGQQWAIKVVFDPANDGPSDVRAKFEAEFRKIYGYIQGPETIRIVTNRVVGRGVFGDVSTKAPEAADAKATPYEKRSVWIDPKIGFTDTPIYRSLEFEGPLSLTGPAVIEVPTTTVLVGREESFTVDAQGNFSIFPKDQGAH